ncbi:MAG TPA: hypothetical protein VLE19_08475 [Pyrinomonadaceae bacterium]|nr:hypothetical protein [Pyrinomonadaceae bacterium]
MKTTPVPTNMVLRRASANRAYTALDATNDGIVAERSFEVKNEFYLIRVLV